MIFVKSPWNQIAYPSSLPSSPRADEIAVLSSDSIPIFLDAENALCVQVDQRFGLLFFASGSLSYKIDLYRTLWNSNQINDDSWHRKSFCSLLTYLIG